MPDERIEADLAAYVDGLLSPERAREIERHLAGNERYRVMVNEMRQARTWLMSLPAVSPPAGVMAWAQADPTIARLERSALFGDDDNAEPATGWELWRGRLLSPNSLGIAASLAVLITLGLAAYLLLPKPSAVPSGSGQVVIGSDDPDPLTANDPDSGNSTLVDPAGENGVDNLQVDDNPGENDDPVEPEQPIRPLGPTIADGGTTPLPDATPERRALPALGSDAVLLTAEAIEPGQVAGELAALLTTRRHAFVVEPDAIAQLPDTLNNRLRRHGDYDAESSVATEGQVAMVLVVQGLTRAEVGSLLSTMVDSRRPLAIWEPLPRQVPHDVQPGRPSSDGFDGDGTPAPPAAAPDAGDAAGAAAANGIYPNDQLRVQFRRLNDLPPNLPPRLTELLTDPMASVLLSVDADGYLDLTGYGLERFDALGMAPRDLSAKLKRQLAFDYLVDADIFTASALKADIPGGRVADVLDLLKLDRNPFKIGDLLRLEMGDGTRLETVVGLDGHVDLGAFGRFEAENRTAGSIQRDVIAELAVLLPDGYAEDDVQPAVVNLSNRRAANKDETATEVIDLAVVILPVSETAATQPATAPGTTGSTDWDD